MDLAIWTGIPDDSWIKVWVEGKPGEEKRFSAEGKFQPANDKEHGTLPDLDQAPRRRKLNSPRVYGTLVTITFADDQGSVATVVAEVRDPQGNLVQQVLPAPTDGDQGKPWRSTDIQGDAGKASSKTVSLTLTTGAA